MNNREEDELERQLRELENAHNMQNGLQQESMPRQRIQRVSVADDLQSDEEDDLNQMNRLNEEEDIHEAIIASLIEYTGQQKNDAGISNEAKEEARLIKEVMHLSKLEEEKKKGKINLDFLKRKNKPEKKEVTPASIIPEPT